MMDLNLMEVATETEMVLRECMLLVVRLDTNMKAQQAHDRLRQEFAMLKPVPMKFYRYKAAAAFFLQHCRNFWELLKEEARKESEAQQANCMLVANEDGQYWIEVERKGSLKTRSLNDDCSDWLDDEQWKNGCLKFVSTVPEKFPSLLF